MQRLKFVIKGIVQGIGFRPYIYNLAKKYNITGFVKNSASGVIIEAQSSKQTLEIFLTQIKHNPLPLSRIDEITRTQVLLQADETFLIIDSDLGEGKTTFLSPDIKICINCIEDINNPNSRFYGYFATNCTNCGPRYSIIKTLPYDRINTSMQPFIMCSACNKEYADVSNRRFHAQPISCPKCGPQLSLYKKDKALDQDPIVMVAKKIKEGAIVAVKGVGGFHIICDATNAKTIQKLRVYKNREKKPFALMCKDLNQANRLAHISKEEEKALLSPQAPIVLMQKKQSGMIFSDVAPDIHKIGIMLAYSGVHHLLFKQLDNPVIATSANLSDEPIITTREGIVDKLSFVEYILDYDREILNAVDDSLVQIIDKKVQVLRGARGYTPLSIKMGFKTDEKLLAVGANQKNSISIAYDDTLILSPHIGELENIENMDFFLRTIKSFERFYDFSPNKIICDKHPGYASTMWAKEQDKDLVQIQHHQAHLNAVQAEYGLQGDNYTGFIYDGTGYGEDNTVWGGEIFVKGKRKYHFKPLKLLGGEKAIKEPKRVALSLLFEKISLQEVLGLDLKVVNEFSKSEIKLLHTAFIKNINTPISSSVGRLFDGIAALGGLAYISKYEGQCGILCERNYNDNNCFFEYEIVKNSIDIKIVEYILSKDFDKSKLPSMLINTLSLITVELAKKEGLAVLLSGGVFQNSILLNLISKKLKQEQIEYYFNALIPANDGGISVGQIYAQLKSFSENSVQT